MKGPVRSRSTAAGALFEGRRPTRIAHGSQQERVEHELDRSCLLGDRTQCSHRQSLKLRGRRAFLAGQPLGSFEYGAGRGVPAVVVDDVGGECVDRLHLSDDVEILARK